MNLSNFFPKEIIEKAGGFTTSEPGIKHLFFLELKNLFGAIQERMKVGEDKEVEIVAHEKGYPIAVAPEIARKHIRLSLNVEIKETP